MRVHRYKAEVARIALHGGSFWRVEVRVFDGFAPQLRYRIFSKSQKIPDELSAYQAAVRGLELEGYDCG